MMIQNERDVHHPVVAKEGMVSSQDALATQAGLEILQAGGNAIDAMVATGFALAVTLPRAGNIGGGGNLVAWLADGQRSVALDYREQAPGAVTPELYWKADGSLDLPKQREGYLSPAVPGTVAGFAHALENWGTMSWSDVIQPAIRLAENGIPIHVDLRCYNERFEDLLRLSEGGRQMYFRPDGKLYEIGEIWKQPNLAKSLRTLAVEGPRCFYEGSIAKAIVTDLQAHGGVMTLEDLAGYEVGVRTPVEGTYRGHGIVGMPPSASGGLLVQHMLNLLEPFPLGELGHNTADTVHLMVEAMKLAYADRAQHFGDPDFWDVPAGMASHAYADERRKLIDPQRARPAKEIAPGAPPLRESSETTHYSVVDRWGNAVSNTYTLLSAYGCGVVPGETGILLNNNMANLDAKPGSPNHFDLIGSEANAVRPKRRPLSSMTPTLVLRDGKPFLVTGSPGGPRIITTVLQMLLNVIDHGMNVAEATSAGRVHHQLVPDEVRVESAFNKDTWRLLEARGHKVAVGDAMGSTQSILIDRGLLFGASDHRRSGALTLGY